MNEKAPNKPTTAEVLALVGELRDAGAWYDGGHGDLHNRAADMLVATLPPGQQPGEQAIEPEPPPPEEQEPYVAPPAEELGYELPPEEAEPAEEPNAEEEPHRRSHRSTHKPHRRR